ncbi:MAG: CotH kinase family protein [Flavobacteriales bacterium]|nr:CotH kinase family protein [Flavobacteriales bacterium]
MVKTLLAFILFLSVGVVFSQAQTFSGSGGNIPDNNTTVSFAINVPPLNPNTVNTLFGIEQVCININHPYVGDLEVSLRAPDNTTVILFSGIGGSGDNFTNTCMRQDAVTSISAGSAPFTGTFKPQNNMAVLNNGQNANGQWRLRIRDMYAQDVGSLVSWSITFGNQPAQPFSFTSSDLPILVINTVNNVNIPDDPKVPANLKLIYNGEGVRNYLTDTTYDYQGQIGIELRGSSSQGMPKKPYGFETWDAQQNDLKVSLLGMPVESDWVLTANYSDKTLFRNALSYNLANKTGQYAPRTRFCEVVVNDDYKGVYILTEKIKRDSGRVNIAKLNSFDISGNELTGGYILKIDKTTGSGGAGWASQIPPPNASGNQTIYYQYVYPKPDSIQPAQQQYIKSFVDSFEAALAAPAFQDPVMGWRRFMDENSVIDFMLVNEMSRNVDGYRISTFLYKEKITRGNKLKLGPVWDYDIAWQNANYCSGANTTGWAYDFNSVCGNDGLLVPFWWQRFRQDTLFNKRLYCRYTEFRNTFLSNAALAALADSMAAVLDESQVRNFERWPILGTYVWPNPNPIPTTYSGEISKLKQWFINRMAWLDGQIAPFATPPPTLNLGADTAICQGQSVYLQPGNHSSYLWSNGFTSSDIFISQPGNVWVQVRNHYGCASTDSIQIAVNPLPDSDFSTIQQTGFTYLFSPEQTGAPSYQWAFGDGFFSSEEFPLHSYAQEGVFPATLIITDNNGCTATQTQNVVSVFTDISSFSSADISLFPNPFTDYLVLKTSGLLEFDITVFSSDGKKMFEHRVQTEQVVLSAQDWAPGLYLLTVSKDSANPITLKLIKK